MRQVLLALLVVLLAGCSLNGNVRDDDSGSNRLPVNSSAGTIADPAATPSTAAAVEGTPAFGASPAATMRAGGTPASADDVAILVGAGDIASCTSAGDEATAKLLDQIPGTVFTAGDNAQDDATAEEFARCYGASWGRHKERTRPAVGNREYTVAGAAAYFEYFGAAAGDPSRGYYSYDLNRFWHVVVLNSNCAEIGGCGTHSPQYQWLDQDLRTRRAANIVAYWHHPRYSSGHYGGSTRMDSLWDLLYDYGAEIVVNGDDHDYERFAPIDNDDERNDTHGIREFVVGTGGKSLRPFGTIAAYSEARSSDTFGVLKLTLYPDHYEWEFVPVAGGTFTDSGSGMCH